MFPDFELRQRATGERWLLEIVGYWTAEYLRSKLAQLREARLERLIVCIDEERCCSDEALELDAHVVRYRRKFDPRAVLAIVDSLAAAARGRGPARVERTRQGNTSKSQSRSPSAGLKGSRRAGQVE
jgi:predicted nuclease of restriction endonuclease-like RecB superfamily